MMSDRPTLWERKWENEWLPFMPLRGMIDLAEVISIYEEQGYQCSCVGELVHAQRDARWKGYTTACVLRRNEEFESWFDDGEHRMTMGFCEHTSRIDK